MHLVGRKNVSGGLSRIYDNSKKQLHSCMLEYPLDTIYADDHRVMHAVDPIRTLDEGHPAHRDILIIDFDHKPLLSIQRETKLNPRSAKERRYPLIEIGIDLAERLLKLFRVSASSNS